ncbi:YjcZ family sporulation protein [Lysinibacillus sphaericus]|uniref:YjcZ family sporulation protein n=1 Tax=Lysinibacillus sphaericus TaxID=1421 RepID=UPI0018CDB78A|nr:YjcZ family sporulation protein [Lysinibacillus sphaericus]
MNLCDTYDGDVPYQTSTKEYFRYIKNQCYIHNFSFIENLQKGLGIYDSGYGSGSSFALIVVLFIPLIIGC